MPGSDSSQPFEMPRLLDGRLKLRHLTLADALSRHGSLIAVAAELRISQPALTRTLRELETIVGVRLYVRGPRGMTPTIFGSAFTDYARAVVASLTQAGRHIAELADARRGTVSVGVFRTGTGFVHTGTGFVHARPVPGQFVNGSRRAFASKGFREHNRGQFFWGGVVGYPVYPYYPYYAYPYAYPRGYYY